MKFTVQLLPRSLEDILAFASCWATEHQSLEQARAWSAAVKKQHESLQVMPERL
ncbi:hypothetical protein CA13_62670 [Planctomycetes bacterium CA13]|uniref:Plasmid stabilization system protein n=1 Tax=Novipirellula herctigrandis TaxID=2527986 RepID=A0A5C5ZCA1_9BACT|nr:hypothetical protein CA13_62670 [Planctomycetes bacterium CA13]